MRATGADLSRIFVLDAVRDLDEEGKAIARCFNLRTDLHHPDASFETLGEVAMMVIDPISALPGRHGLPRERRRPGAARPAGPTSF